MVREPSLVSCQKRLILTHPDRIISYPGGSSILTGSLFRKELREWLSPPDPSTNHNIACGAHLKRTATWFLQGSTFQKWKSSSSLLWIHGKRMFLTAIHIILLMVLCLPAGSGKSVLWSVGSRPYLSKITDVVSQFHNHSKH